MNNENQDQDQNQHQTQDQTPPPTDSPNADFTTPQPLAPHYAQQPEQPSQSATILPTTHQYTETLPNSNPNKSKKTPLVLASVAFILLSIAFLILGPGVMITAKLTEPFSWIVSFYYVYLVVGTSVVSLISTILYTIACIMTFKKAPKYLTNILIMLAGNAIGLATMWLSGYKIIRIPIVPTTIIMLACVILPCLGLIILRRFRKQNASQPKTYPIPIFISIAMLALIIESGVAIFYLSQLWHQYRPIIEANQQYQKKQEEQFAETTSDKNLSDRLGPMSFALCQGGFDIVHQIQGNEEDAIVQCNSTSDIYELHSAYEKENGYTIASAIYYGTTKDEILARYFPNQLYIYKNLYNSSYNEEVYLLLQANTIEEVIKKYSEPLYEYIKEQNANYQTDITFEILYNEDLSRITTTKDYTLLAGLHDIVNDWLPHGNGFNGPRGENYIFYGVDDVRVLDDLGMHPDSYSEQTRNAIKFHPHLSFSITNGKQITLKELQTIMQNSQFCQNADLGWEPCS